MSSLSARTAVTALLLTTVLSSRTVSAIQVIDPGTCILSSFVSSNTTRSGEVSSDHPPSIAPWGFGPLHPLRLWPEQILPPEFLKRLNATQGRVKLQISRPMKTKPVIAIRLYTEENLSPFVELELSRDSSQPHALKVDNLLLENPFGKNPANLRLSQQRKGLPFPVVRSLRNGLLNLARSGGFTQILAEGAQSYEVLQLYLKLLGMRPADPASKARIAQLDSLSQFARNRLPEPDRLRTLDAFARALGSVDTAPENRHAADALAWKSYRQGMPLPTGYELLKEGSQTLGMIVRDRNQPPRMIFLDTLRPDTPILDWTSLIQAHELTLALDVDKESSIRGF